MKIPSTEVEAMVASSSDIRAYLRHVWLDRENCRLMSTDGHALAVVPLQPDDLHDDDATGPVTVEAVKAARKCAKRTPLAPEALRANGKLDVLHGPSFERPQDGAFPDVTRVMVRREDVAGAYVSFNAELLHRLAKALNEKGEDPVVRLFVPYAGNVPIRVEPCTGPQDEKEMPVGVMMPFRDGDDTRVVYPRELAEAEKMRQELRDLTEQAKVLAGQALAASGDADTLAEVNRLRAAVRERIEVLRLAGVTVGGETLRALTPTVQTSAARSTSASRPSPAYSGSRPTEAEALRAKIADLESRQSTPGVKAALTRARQRLAAVYGERPMPPAPAVVDEVKPEPTPAQEPEQEKAPSLAAALSERQVYSFRGTLASLRKRGIRRACQYGHPDCSTKDEGVCSVEVLARIAAFERGAA